MRDAGAIVAETFSDFVGLVRLSSSIGNRSFSGHRLAMMTNAGFEAVGMADNHQADSHTLVPAKFSKRTARRVSDELKASNMDALVQISNPLDLTPMANDALHVVCMGAILKDSGVDAAVFGCVPFTSAIQALPNQKTDAQFLDARDSYPYLTIELFNNSTKPFVIVINAGRDYDALVSRLEHGGVPVFRNADEATRLLGIYVERKIGPLSGA
jgi:acyl-CoA synthetase (NDP forming)